MNNTASILLLLFLVLTFVQSAYEKIFDWKDSVDWLKNHFAQTRLKNAIEMALIFLVFLELVSGILCAVGVIELWINNGRNFGFYGAVMSSITLLIMLFGQRLAKDYDGARTIVIYLIPTIMAVYWLN